MSAPRPLQAGPRKLKKDKNDNNVKNRMTMVFRKTFAMPSSPARSQAIEAPKQQSHYHSPSDHLPSYTSASSSPSRGQMSPVLVIARQGSVGTATRDYGRSNKPQAVATEGLVARRAHVGAGVVGTSPPLPPIPLISNQHPANDFSQYRESCDGLGIGLDLSLANQRSETSTPVRLESEEQERLDFPILANVSHVRTTTPAVAAKGSTKPTVVNPVIAVEPLRIESSRDRLLRTRASISEAATTEPVSPSRGANRLNGTRCYTVAGPPSGFDVALVRPPKSTLRPLKSATTTGTSPSAIVAAWTSRPDASPRTMDSPAVAGPPSAGLYCLRPTVHASTQTPDWYPSAPSGSRRLSSTPPQGYSSFSRDVVQPSPSVYSIASFDARSRNIGHQKQESLSSFYGVQEDIREIDEDLTDVIDRHLGELREDRREQYPNVQVAKVQLHTVDYDVPFLKASPYDTPQLRPFEIPPTPLAVPPTSEGLVPSPALTAGGITPTLDRTPTIPSKFESQQIPSRSPSSESSHSRSTTPVRSYSPSSSTSRGSSEPSTPPTSATSSNFDDVSIQLAEQEPITIRKASLVSSLRKSSIASTASLSTDPSSRPHSVHSVSSGSGRSVKFKPEVSYSSDPTQSPRLVVDIPSLTFDAPPVPSIPSPIRREFSDSSLSAPEDKLALRRRSESDKPIPRLRNADSTTTTMSREERAAKGRSYFLVQALLGETVPSDGVKLMRDWARDTDDESSDDDGNFSEAESEAF